MRLSIVSTLYRSEPYIEEFYQRSKSAASAITDSFEIILVNDGSPDQSLAIAQKLCDKDPAVRVLNLSRNFGHHKAIMTGLAYAKGDFVFLTDCDLEEPPELLTRFWQEMESSPETDVVYGVQESRRGGWMDRDVGALFYVVFNALSDQKIPEDTLIARLMRRAYVRDLIRFQEADLVFAGVCALAGYNQQPVAVEKGHKKATTYTLPHKIGVMVNAVTSFSAKPLFWIFYLGCAMSAVSLLFLCFLLYVKFVLNSKIEGWTSVVASIWFFGGLILFSLGLIGIYIAKIYVQVKQRPFTIIKEEYAREREPETCR